MKTFRVTRPPSPWLTEEIKNTMENRDRYKNKFNTQKRNNDSKNDLDYTYNIYQGLRNKVSHMVRSAKIKMFDNLINSKLVQPKDFHNALKKNNVVEGKSGGTTHTTISPSTLNKSFLANNNANVDEEKISNEINKILEHTSHPNFNFQEVTENEIRKTLKSIKTNACGVDNISAYFIKLSIDQTIKPITDIINNSFRTNNFPSRWKMALVKPLPKISTPSEPSDYRPISLLPAISKIIEKIAAKQMINYLKEKCLLDEYQSAYKHGHGTLTALLNITDDIYDAFENSEVTLLVLLDYSKAFDCANHRLIIAKLKKFGFHNEALHWVESYLSDRSQKVCAGDDTSNWEQIKNGVPQGSILGPLLFTILISDINKVIKNGKYHLYADDTQLYYRCSLNNLLDTMHKINSDLKGIADFSNRNCLKLNNDKSNYIILGSHPNLKTISRMVLPVININNQPIKRKNEVKNLGVIFDETLSWDKHINRCIGKAYGKLKQAYRFKNFLSKS